MVTMAAMATGAWASEIERPERKVMKTGDTRVYASRTLVSKMFARIGVDIEWSRDLRSCADRSIVVGFTITTPPERLPGALAYARPYVTEDPQLLPIRFLQFILLGFASKIKV